MKKYGHSQQFDRTSKFATKTSNEVAYYEEKNILSKIQVIYPR